MPLGEDIVSFNDEFTGLYFYDKLTALSSEGFFIFDEVTFYQALLRFLRVGAGTD